MSTTTTTTTKTAENRVSSIRNKFETLFLDHLDHDNNNNNSTITPKHPFVFRRSATTLNLPVSANNNKENASRLSRRRDVLEPLMTMPRKLPLNGGVPVAVMNPNFQRQNSDTRRSSIKRSPAFRVGDPHNKALLIKSKSLSDAAVVPPLTDTLKKALRQPLPTGPPPKKPPRLIASPVATSRASSRAAAVAAEETVPAISAREGSGKWKRRLASVAPKARAGSSTTTCALANWCVGGGSNGHAIYDDVASSYYGARPDTALERLMSTSEIPKRKIAAEPVYMEPFQHLTQRRFSEGSVGRVACKKTCKNGGLLQRLSENRVVVVSRSSGDDEDADQTRNMDEEAVSVCGSVRTTCSCPEQHSAHVVDKQDMHYLVIFSIFSFVFDRLALF